MKIKIAKDFTDTTGARYRKDGNYSGEEFYEDILKPKFQECLQSGEILEIDFDDCFGFASSFLDESFGRLSVDFGRDVVLRQLKMISFQDPLVITSVKNIINEPLRNH